MSCQSTYLQLYNSNKNFKTYVDKYCRNYTEGTSITVNEGLQHEMVKQYAIYLKSNDSKLDVCV